MKSHKSKAFVGQVSNEECLQRLLERKCTGLLSMLLLKILLYRYVTLTYTDTIEIGLLKHIVFPWLVSEKLSTRHGIPPCELLVRGVFKKTWGIAIVFDFPPHWMVRHYC